jgi:hypothetical protein
LALKLWTRSRNVGAIIDSMESRTLFSTFVVNTVSDTPTAGLLDFRQAVAAANAHAGADTITFAPSVFTTGTLHTIKLLSGQIVFSDTTGATTVSGPGSSVLAVNGNKNGRVFQVNKNATVSLSGMVITNGFLSASALTQGGGIYNAGKLTVVGCTVSNNTASGGDGATGFDAQGGGIYNAGSLNLSSSTITGNIAYSGNSFDPGNSNGDVSGGGIYTATAITITASTISSNTAQISPGSNQSQYGNAYGGGIYAGASLTLNTVYLANNTATGGQRNDPSDYSAGHAGSAFGGGVYATVGTTLTVQSSTISGNSANGGEAFYSTAGFAYGGGVFAAGSVTLTGSTVASNTATGGGGEVTEPAGGGGIFSDGNVTASSSTINNNTATGGAGDNVDGLSPGPAGALGMAGGIDSDGKLSLTNSTVANNSALGGKGGPGEDDAGANLLAGGKGGNATAGGMYVAGGMLLKSSTISGNIAAGGKGATGGSGMPNGANGTGTGGGVTIISGTAVADNTIISANHGTSDLDGGLSSTSAHNLVGTGSGLVNGSDGNKVGVTNPKLSSLGSYGGPTQTMPPVSGSPAIDAGSNALLGGLTLDQRGFPRISGSATDIGSVEFGNASISGTVFNDSNANGKKDAGENGLGGIKLFIDLNQDGSPDNGDPVVTTNSSGNFTFSNLPAGTYRVWEETPVGYRVDSPVSFFSDVTVQAGKAVTGVLFADTQKILLSGNVFNDLNGNQVQDSGESGLAGWKVYVDTNNSGIYQAGDPTVTTSANGSWQFTNLSAGTAIVRVVPQSGWTQTTPSIGYFKFVTGPGAIRVNNAFGEQKTAVVLNSESRQVHAAGGSLSQTFTSTGTGVFDKTASVTAASNDGGTSSITSDISTSAVSFNGDVTATGNNDTGFANATVDVKFTVSSNINYSLKYTAAGNDFTLELKKLNNGGAYVVAPIGSQANVQSYNGTKTGTLAAGQYELYFIGAKDTTGSPYFLSTYNVSLTL